MAKKVSKKNQEVVDRFKKNTYQMAIKFFGIFGAIAVAGALIGHYIDKQFEIQPYGTLVILAISYVITWVYILMTIKKFSKVKKEDTDIKK